MTMPSKPVEMEKFLFNCSICICTRNRPQDLEKALNSIKSSTYSAFEVIVSDDSTNNKTKEIVASQFPSVIFVDGPRKGLGANRNNALKVVTGSHVLFIDDDVILSEGFLDKVHKAYANLARSQDVSGIIISGLENKNGKLIYPGDQSFLGYQNVKYQEGDILRTVVINSAVFPISVFKEVLFDERLVYGNDEVDLTTQATCNGFRIVLLPEAINFHYPSETNRDYYEPFHDATRIYVTFKRYFYTENAILKATTYLPYALLYTALRNFKYKGFQSFPGTLNTLIRSLKFIVNYSIEHSRSVSKG